MGVALTMNRNKGLGFVYQPTYRRYAVSDETSLKEAAAKLAALHGKGQMSTESPSHLSKQSQSKSFAVEPGQR